MKLLVRAFLAQFFTSETVTSDVQMRQAIAGALAFVLTPGILLLLEVFPDYQSAVIRVHAHRAPAGLIDDRLEWIVLMLCAYSMVTIGLVAAYAWDALAFDRRDAMVLGPLPLRGRTIVCAKLGALATMVLGASAIINLLNGVVFAFETSDLLGAPSLVAHLLGFVAATIGGAIVVFALMVTVRGALALFDNARLIALAGSLLQCAFVVALLWCVAVTPFVGPAAGRNGIAVSREATDALPWTWFVGLFETIRRSPRADWPEFAMLSHRALASLGVSVNAAVLVSVLAFHRQMQAALTPAALPGPLGRARAVRALARLLTGRDRRAAAVSDFIVTTLARNRAPQSYVAMNAAVGVAWIILGVSRHRGEWAPALPPSPLVLAFWTLVGVRASFFMPSELPAAWTFQFHAPADAVSLLRGVRSATLALVAPATAALAWAAGGWHHAVTTLLVVVTIVNTMVLTIDFLPFTRPYEPGHAKLRTRWPLYPIGCAVVAYALPLAPLWALAAAAVAAHAAGTPAARRWRLQPQEDWIDEESTVTVLDLLGARGV